MKVEYASSIMCKHNNCTSKLDCKQWTRSKNINRTTWLGFNQVELVRSVVQYRFMFKVFPLAPTFKNLAPKSQIVSPEWCFLALSAKSCHGIAAYLQVFQRCLQLSILSSSMFPDTFSLNLCQICVLESWICDQHKKQQNLWNIATFKILTIRLWFNKCQSFWTVTIIQISYPLLCLSYVAWS